MGAALAATWIVASARAQEPALATPGAAASAQDSPSAAPVAAARARGVDDALVRALLEATAHPDRREALVDVLVALPPSTASELFEIAATREIAVALDDARTVRVPIAEGVGDAVVRALARFPEERVRRLAEGASFAAWTPLRREVALRALAGVADATDVAALLRIAEPPEPRASAPVTVSDALETALAAVLARDASAAATLLPLYASSHPSLVVAIVAAVERAGTDASLAVLAELLGVRPQADVVVLAAMERLAHEGAAPSDRAREAVRRRLLATDPSHVHAAIRAAAALQDADAVPDLIACLERADAGLAEHALDALRRIARHDAGASAADWQRWSLAETRRWHARGAALTSALRQGSSEDAARAIVELGRQRLYRREAARALELGLVRGERSLVGLCCDVLASMGSPEATRSLESALHHPSATVREAARTALARHGRDVASVR